MLHIELLLWLRVLAELPHDLVEEVVRTVPGSFNQKLLNLPEGFRPLAAHPHIPTLAAASFCATGSALNNGADLASFDLCVAVPQPPEAAPRSDDASDSATVTLAKECMWLHEWPIDADAIDEGHLSAGR